MTTGRTAIIHDWLTGMRGGERVLEALCTLYPEAELFTLLHVPGSVSPAIERRLVLRGRRLRVAPRAQSLRRSVLSHTSPVDSPRQETQR